ncbi:response regulator transcription factor [Candidatus Daviesbacteria bacterium]|nr:response regulator transcription factor [Candidatus Daviesbacteria bacterium]
MERALVVEDTEKWQNFHRGLLEPILGEGNVDVVANYDDAISMLGRDYRAYILDVQFPRHRFGKPQLLGVQLAQEIMRREGSHHRIVVVSSHMSIEAQNLGITRIYNKYSLKADKNEVATFLRDLRSLFNI